jgi:hypothetical protein
VWRESADDFLPGDYQVIGGLCMRRTVVSSVAAALLLCLSGCGGDEDLGVPKDVGPAKSIDMTKQLDVMKKEMNAQKTAAPNK